jgi:hypothetical protein
MLFSVLEDAQERNYANDAGSQLSGAGIDGVHCACTYLSSCRSLLSVASVALGCFRTREIDLKSCEAGVELETPISRSW